MPILKAAMDWKPFKIDALGIVTLLGAENLRQSVSRLVPHPFAEHLPLLAAQIFADDTITDNLSGFTLYNITDGVLATDVSAWWQRWLTCQKLNFNTTTFHVTALTKPRPLFTTGSVLAICINAMVNAALIIVAVLLGDWYGFATSVSLVVTVIARTYILSSLRQSVDELVAEADAQSTESVILFLKLPDGKAVTVRTTRGIATCVLLTEARPKHHSLYLSFRALDWVAFGVLVVCLGSACLCMQLIVIATMLFATVFVVFRIGCDEYHIGRRLEIVQDDRDGNDDRHLAYLRMELTEDQERSMIDWHLFPMTSNKVWWNRYRKTQRTMEDCAETSKAANVSLGSAAPA
jgi:hypothetical protein